MAKLQEIKRTNGSTINLVNIPKDAIEESKLKKGDNLEVKSDGVGLITIKKLGDDD